MKRPSPGVFTLYVSSGLTCVALATATISASPASEHGRKDNERGGGSPFVSMKPCSVSDSGRFRFMSGRNPFQGGGGGAYGDIFFAGGGSRVESTATSSSAPAAAEAHAAVVPVAPLPAPPRTATGTPAAGAAPVAGALAAVTLPPTAAAAAVAATADVTPGGPGPRFDQDPPLPQVGGAVTPITSAAPAAHTPEPASLMLIGLGLSAVAMIRRRAERNHKP